MAESPLPEPTIEDRTRARFITASTGQPPTDKQRETVELINELVVRLAVAVEALTPRSRNQSLALTALEDVQMRANRAVFATGPSA